MAQGDTSQFSLHLTETDEGSVDGNMLFSVIPDPESLPLLKIPECRHKVYTRADVDRYEVIKGPYTSNEMYQRTLTFHRVMRDELDDKHTLPFEERQINGEHFLVFPLIKGSEYDEEIPLSKRTFADPIADGFVREDIDFIDMDGLGLTSVDQMTPQDIAQLPMSFWLHFVYRFGLNVGDSGLDNGISDGENLYGIDLDEVRHYTDDSSLCGLIFSRRPREELCEVIEQRIRDNACFVIFQTGIAKSCLTDEKMKGDFCQRMGMIETCLEKEISQ